MSNTSHEQAHAIIKNWLLECNEIERLSPSIRAFDTLIDAIIVIAAVMMMGMFISTIKTCHLLFCPLY
jgi:hypothetical protein